MKETEELGYEDPVQDILAVEFNVSDAIFDALIDDTIICLNKLFP